MNLKIIQIGLLIANTPGLIALLFFESGFFDQDMDNILNIILWAAILAAIVVAYVSYKTYHVPILSPVTTHIKRIASIVFGAYILNILSFILLLFAANIALDNRQTVYEFEGLITGKLHSDSPRSAFYSITIHDKKLDRNINFNVSRRFYNDVEHGKPASIKFYAGRFGLSWRYSGFNLFPTL